MRWPQTLHFDVTLSIFLACIVKQSISGDVSWPLPLSACLVAVAREMRRLIPAKQDPTPEAIQRLGEEMKTLRDKMTTMEFVQKLRPKVPTDVR